MILRVRMDANGFSESVSTGTLRLGTASSFKWIRIAQDLPACGLFSQFSSVQFSSVQFSSVQFCSVHFISVRFSSVRFSPVQINSIKFLN